MKLKITSDDEKTTYNPNGIKIANSETGEKLEGVTELVITVTPEEPVTATVKFLVDDLNLEEVELKINDDDNQKPAYLLWDEHPGTMEYEVVGVFTNKKMAEKELNVLRKKSRKEAQPILQTYFKTNEILS